MQWHPHFAKLLRPLLDGYYDVQVNVPVGDAPREADLVLVRRTAAGTPPFHGLWRHLTRWNVFEYKGPTVSARLRDLELLLELGLGIDRRLREKGTIPAGAGTEDVSFWYLAHHLGRRFLKQSAQALGALEEVGPGIWRCRILRRLVFLVSGGDLPVEAETLPFHILEPGSAASETALARLLLSRPQLLSMLGDWAISLHPILVREVANMPKTKQFKVSVKPILEFLGEKEMLRQLSQEKKIDKKAWIKQFMATLPAAERRSLTREYLQESSDE